MEVLYGKSHVRYNNTFNYMPITGTTLELPVFWPSDTESRINELRFSESISLSFKTRLTSVTCFCGGVKPHSHCAGVATVHPDAGQPVYRDAPGHIS